MNDYRSPILIEDLNRTELAGTGWHSGRRTTAGAGDITGDLRAAKVQPGRDHLEFRCSVAANPDVGKIACMGARLIKPMPLARRAQMPARGFERRLAPPGFMNMDGVPSRRKVDEFAVDENTAGKLGQRHGSDVLALLVLESRLRLCLGGL